MICFVALIVFAVLGIFSAGYRGYFFEASDCIFRRVTLRKCNTSFDTKMKMKITSKVSKVSKPFGGFIFKNFEALSWVLTIVMIVSLLWSGYTGAVAVYNWVEYGNCNGPDSGLICELNQLVGMDPVTGEPIIVSGDLNDINAICPPGAVK